MISSSKPRKQRKFRFNAPMHERQRFLHVHLSKEVKAKLGIKKRATQIRKGDMVRVVSGAHKGKTGKVSMVSLRSNRIYVDSIVRKTQKGKEIHIPVYSSNVYITDLDLADKMRKKSLGVA
jgi:large subunit ribosomal protein L24